MALPTRLLLPLATASPRQHDYTAPSHANVPAHCQLLPKSLKPPGYSSTPPQQVASLPSLSPKPAHNPYVLSYSAPCPAQSTEARTSHPTLLTASQAPIAVGTDSWQLTDKRATLLGSLHGPALHVVFGYKSHWVGSGKVWLRLEWKERKQSFSSRGVGFLRRRKRERRPRPFGGREIRIGNKKLWGLLGFKNRYLRGV